MAGSKIYLYIHLFTWNTKYSGSFFRNCIDSLAHTHRETLSMSSFIFPKFMFRSLRDKVSLEATMALRSDFNAAEGTGSDGRLINNYWMRLSMISWIIKTEVCVICRSRRLRQITQTQGFDNSWYHAKNEFNNCFIIHFLNNRQNKTFICWKMALFQN